MKKAIITALVLGLVAGSMTMPAEAGKKKKKPKRVERTVEGSYDAPPLIIAGTCTQTGAIGCVAFATAPNERFVTATATDAHGQDVYVALSADTNGDNQDDTSFGEFCGESAEPIAIPGGVEVHMWVGLTPDPGIAGCVPGAATTGTITATFSNLP